MKAINYIMSAAFRRPIVIVFPPRRLPIESPKIPELVMIVL